MSVKYSKWPKKYSNIFPSKAQQNLPKLGFFYLKIKHMATLSGCPPYVGIESARWQQQKIREARAKAAEKTLLSRTRQARAYLHLERRL
jgi:hypothetical protein